MSPLLPEAFDLHTEARLMSYRDISFISLLKQLWKSDWAESRDATPFDVTFESAEEREATSEGVVNPRTFYRSYAAYVVSTSISLQFWMSLNSIFPYRLRWMGSPILTNYLRSYFS